MCEQGCSFSTYCQSVTISIGSTWRIVTLRCLVMCAAITYFIQHYCRLHNSLHIVDLKTGCQTLPVHRILGKGLLDLDNTFRPEKNDWHFCRWHFQMAFSLMKNMVFFIIISLRFVPKCPVHNKSLPVWIMVWWSTITWTNDDPVHWCIYASLGLNKFISGNIKIFSHSPSSLSSLYTEMTQVFEILVMELKDPIIPYSPCHSCWWPGDPRFKEPGHQQP